MSDKETATQDELVSYTIVVIVFVVVMVMFVVVEFSLLHYI